MTGRPTPAVRAGARYRLIHAVNWLLVRALWRVEASGLEHWPQPPFVLVVNHHNAWDSQIVMAVAPASPVVTWFGPRTDDPDAGWMNAVIRWAGVAIPIRRDGSDLVSAARTVRQLLAAGGVLGIFPEGHAGYRESTVLPFEDGAIAFAATAGVPLVPCAIVGSNRLWWGRTVIVRSGTPIPTIGRRGRAEREGLETEIRGALIGLLPSSEPPLPARRPFERFLTTVLEGEPDRSRRRQEQGL